MAIHPSILAWRIPWTEEPGRAHGVRRELDTTEQLTLSLPLNLVWPSVMFLASLSLILLSWKEAYLPGWLAHSKKVLQHDGSSQVALVVKNLPTDAGDLRDMG